MWRTNHAISLSAASIRARCRACCWGPWTVLEYSGSSLTTDFTSVMNCNFCPRLCVLYHYLLVWNMIWYTFLGILHHCNYLLLFRNCNYWVLVSVSCVCLYVHTIPGLILIYFWDQGDVLYVAFIQLTSEPVATFFCYSFETGKEQTNMAAYWDQIQNEKVLHYGTIQSLQMEVHNNSVYSYKPICIFSWCPL